MMCALCMNKRLENSAAQLEDAHTKEQEMKELQGCKDIDEQTPLSL